MRLINQVIFLSILGLILQSCTSGSSNTNSTSPNANINVMQIKVSEPNSFCQINDGPNVPCVSVTICSPSNPNSCQTIDNIILDTGSTGLRIFESLVTVNLESTLISNKELSECVSYTGGQSTWGPVKVANVILANESAVAVPIQLINGNYADGGESEGCTNPLFTPEQQGGNGILGINQIIYDCGDACAQSGAGQYFICNGTICTPSAVPLAQQIINPIAKLPLDNNGEIFTLPQVSESGAITATGTLILGIGTRNNNQPRSGLTTILTDTTGNIAVNFNGVISPGYIDSGTNFNALSDNNLNPCTYESGPYYCPNELTNLSATNFSYNGIYGNVNFQVGNAESLLSGPNNVFSNVTYQLNSLQEGTFVWGLNFFFGRSVYLGLESANSSLGVGPYYAY